MAPQRSKLDEQNKQARGKWAENYDKLTRSSPLFPSEIATNLLPVDRKLTALPVAPI